MGEVGHILSGGLWVLKYAAEHVREPSGLSHPMCGEGGQLADLVLRNPESASEYRECPHPSVTACLSG